MFHHLISDLPTCDLADTLEGFHIAPSYLKQYDTVCRDQSQLLAKRISLDPRLKRALDFVERRRDGVDVLEAACARGELQRRPIHGTPKSTT